MRPVLPLLVGAVRGGPMAAVRGAFVAVVPRGAVVDLRKECECCP